MSESDVYRRQILTYKDGPRTERVKATMVNKGYHVLRIVFVSISKWNMFLQKKRIAYNWIIHKKHHLQMYILHYVGLVLSQLLKYDKNSNTD